MPSDAGVRLSPTVRGDGDPNFAAALVGTARAERVSGYISAGRNHWPAVYRLDAARLFRPALERAPAVAVLHGVADEGVTVRVIAEATLRHLGVPTVSVPPEGAGAHSGWLAGFAALDVRASSIRTRELPGWEPTHPGLPRTAEHFSPVSPSTCRQLSHRSS